MSKLVYLAGPITGLNYKGAVDWRNEAIKQLARSSITGLSPMRHKEYLQSEECIAHSYESSTLSCAKGITVRDRWDCERCDILLVNLLGAEKVSIGTMLEIGWASANRKPIVLVIEQNGNVHDHPMIRETAGFIVDNLDAAIVTIKAILA